MISKGFTVLSVADRPFEKFTLHWLRQQVERYNPRIIEMTARQATLFSSGRVEDKPAFRGIPVRIVNTSFFGNDIL